MKDIRDKSGRVRHDALDDLAELYKDIEAIFGRMIEKGYRPYDIAAEIHAEVSTNLTLQHLKGYQNGKV